MTKDNIKTLLIHILSVSSIIVLNFLSFFNRDNGPLKSIAFSVTGVTIYVIGVIIYQKINRNTNNNTNNLVEEEQEHYLNSMISILYYISTSEDEIEEREVKIARHLLYEVGLLADVTELEKVFGISGGQIRESQDYQNPILKGVHAKENLLNNFEKRVNELFITMIDNAQNDNRDITILKDAHENSKTGILDTRKNIEDISEEDIVSIIESIYNGIRLIINDYFNEEILPSSVERK